MKISMSRFLLAALMFVLVVLGEGMTLRSYSLYLICGIMIIYILATMHKNEEKFFVNTELVLLLAFLIYSGVSYLWSLDTVLTLYRTKVLFFLIALTFLLTNLFARDGEYDRFIMLYWAMALILSILGIMRYGVSGIRNFIVSGVRLGKGDALLLGHNPNTIGMDCAFAGVITFYYFFFKGKKAALWSLVPIVIIVVASGSRKGLFILMSGLILMVFFLQMQKEKAALPMLFKMLLIAAGLIAIVNVVLQFPGMEKAREQYMGLVNSLLGNEEEADVSTQIRENMVHVGWDQFLRTPILGIGLDNAKIVNLKYNNFYGYLHNNYIEILVNGGIVGFLIYYSFFIVILKKHINRLYEKDPFVYISLTLLILRLITDWGRISYFDYMNIPLFAFWIAVSNKFDLCRENKVEPEKGSRYLRLRS